MNIVEYEHHGQIVKVRKDLKGKHRQHCLCHQCSHFHPAKREFNCKIANDNFALCVKYGVTTPVWECPHYEKTN